MIAYLYIRVLNVGRALEVVTLKVYMKQREKEEYIDQLKSSLSLAT
jgi:hypothetical protein